MQNVPGRRNGRMTTAYLAAALGLAVLLAGTGRTWAANEESLPGRRLMADSLTDDARQKIRNTSLPPELLAKQALVLLETAQQLTPDSPEILWLLADKASAAKQYDLALKSLKELVRLDPENLAAQVGVLDLLAFPKPAPQQLAIYQAAMNAAKLNPQVRSEAAERVGRLLANQKDIPGSLKALTLAVQLNDANTMAWQDLIRLQILTNALPQDRVTSCLNALQANPFQPEVLLSGARTLAGSHVHDVAADWLVAVVEQMRMGGGQAPVELGVELGVELACANRRVEADTLSKELLAMEKFPPTVAELACLLRAPNGVVPTAVEDPVLEIVRKKAAAAVTAAAADPKSETPPALAEAIWAELMFASTPQFEQVNDWMEKLRLAVGAEDPQYQRLFGWRLLRLDKVVEAEKVFTPLSTKDPLAMLGLIRIAESRGDVKQAKEQLQTLWNAGPVGMPALHVLGEARKLGVVLQDPPLTAALRTLAKTYPDKLLGAQRNPRDILQFTATLTKQQYTLGDPAFLNVEVRNQTDHALSVGPTGAVCTNLALGGTLRGMDEQDLGIFGIENAARVYRIERRGTVVLKMRVDQGLLRDILYNNPRRLFSVGLLLITSPRSSSQGTAVPGLGGQRVPAGMFERQGYGLGGADQLAQLARDLPSSSPDKQMLLGSVLQAGVYNIPEDNTAPETPADPGAASQPAGITFAEARKAIIGTLLLELQHGQPVVQAWLLRNAPAKELPQPILDALAQLADSKEPLVRMIHYERLWRLARTDPAKRTAMAVTLRELVDKEPDPLAKRWVTLLAEEAEYVAPTTAPALTP